MLPVLSGPVRPGHEPGLAAPDAGGADPGGGRHAHRPGRGQGKAVSGTSEWWCFVVLRIRKHVFACGLDAVTHIDLRAFTSFSRSIICSILQFQLCLSGEVYIVVAVHGHCITLSLTAKTPRHSSAVPKPAPYDRLCTSGLAAPTQRLHVLHHAARGG